jgi:serine protease Do
MRTLVRWTGLFVLLLAGSSLLPGQPAPPGPSPDARTSPAIAKVFREVVAPACQSTVRVRCNGNDVALGTVVGADGWILTKCSELNGHVTCVLPDGKSLPAEILGVHEPFDLALLKVEARGLLPVTWTDSKVAAVGRWVASPGPGTGTDPLAIGVVSVATRPYKLGDQPVKYFNVNAGFLGINMENAPDGARITLVTKGTAAETAGLQVGDVITHSGTRRILDMEALINTVNRYRPGEELTLQVERGAESREVRVVLGKRPPMLLGNPQERMGSILSNRRGEFPLILQHDSTLKYTDCGGPLVDLDGHVVGLNIARAGRVETYAIPGEAIRDLLPALRSGKLTPSADLLRELTNGTAVRIPAFAWGADQEDPGEVRQLAGHTGSVLALAVSPDGRHAITGSADKTVRLWDLEAGTLVRTLEVNAGSVGGVAISADGRRALVSGETGKARLWDVVAGKEVGQVGAEKGNGPGVAFSRDGRLVATCEPTGTAIWNAETLAPVLRFTGKGLETAVTFSPDGRFVLTGGTEVSPTLRLFDLRTGRQATSYDGHTATVTAVTFSPDGRQILSASRDGTVRLWERESGVEIRKFAGHAGGVTGVAFSPDSSRAISCGVDGAVRLWEVTTGRQLQHFTAHAGGAFCVGFSPDGCLAISGGADRMVRIWKLPR